MLAATGSALADDATLLILDRRGHHGRGRAGVDGADRPGAPPAAAVDG